MTRVLLLLAAVGVPMARVLHARRAALAGLAHVQPLTPGHTASPRAPALPAPHCTSVAASHLPACLDAANSTAHHAGTPGKDARGPTMQLCLAAYVALLLLRAKVGGTARLDTVMELEFYMR